MTINTDEPRRYPMIAARPSLPVSFAFFALAAVVFAVGASPILGLAARVVA